MIEITPVKKSSLKFLINAGALLGLASLLACTSSSAISSSKSDMFKWTSSAPLISPSTENQNKIYGVKDPSIVKFKGKYHLFMTLAGDNGWSLAYTSFNDWHEAKTAPIIPLDKSPMGPGYRAAPQVFYFAPQNLWYLVYQGGPPLYSTNDDISNPYTWSEPKPFFNTTPELLKLPDGNSSWLDFWNICDDKNCYLFFTGDNGDFYRAETSLSQFPQGFHNTTRVLSGNRDDIFEASNTYKLEGTDTYLTLIEAIGKKGRYFRAWTSTDLAGDWQPIATSPMNTFADFDGVTFSGDAWAEGVSHGEMLRSSVDQTLAVDPCKPLQYLYQGLDITQTKVTDYIKLPYKLALITAAGPNPLSNLCHASNPVSASANPNGGEH